MKTKEQQLKKAKADRDKARDVYLKARIDDGDEPWADYCKANAKVEELEKQWKKH